MFNRRGGPGNRQNVGGLAQKPVVRSNQDTKAPGNLANKFDWNKDHLKLSLEDLAKIEIFSYNEWSFMFEVGPKVSWLRCNLCITNMMVNITSVRQHMMSRRHIKSLESVSQYHHPKLDPKKNLTAIKVDEKNKNKNTAQKETADNSPKEVVSNSSQKITETISQSKVSDVKKVQPVNLLSSAQVTLSQQTLRINMPRMDSSGLKLIKFRYINTDWQNMYTEDKNGKVSCVMCKSVHDDWIGIKLHMGEKKHRNNLNLVKGLYHPVISPHPEYKESKDNQASNDDDKDISIETKETTRPLKLVINPLSIQKQDEKVSVPVKNITEQKKVVATPTKITTKSNDSQQKVSQTVKPDDLKQKKPATPQQQANISAPKQQRQINPVKQLNPTASKQNILQQKSNLPGSKQTNVQQNSNSSAPKQTTVQPLNSANLEQTNLPQQTDPADPKQIAEQQEPSSPKLNPVLIQIKKKLTKDMESMSMSDLKLVEYKDQSYKWVKMIAYNSRKMLICSLCRTAQIDSLTSFKQHINGKKHQLNLSAAKGVFHPISAPDKNLEYFVESEKETPLSTKVTTSAKKTVTQEKQSSTINSNQNKGIKHNSGKVQFDIILENNEEIIRIDDSPERELLPEPEKVIEKDMVLNPISVINKSLTSNTDRIITPTISRTEQKQSNPPRNNFQLKPAVLSLENRAIIQARTTPEEPIKPAFNQAQNQNKSNQSRPRTEIVREMPVIVPQNNSFEQRVYSVFLEGETDGLIGVEYVVKILQNVNDTTPKFECCLCEFEVDGVGMQSHLKDLTHRLKYLDRHFPTCMKQFEPYRKDKKYNNLLWYVTDKIAKAVEEYHGRDLPFECLYDEYRLNRTSIMSKVYSFKHSSEYSGPSFTNVIDKRTLEGLVKSKDINTNPLPNSTQNITFDGRNNNNSKSLQTKPQSPKLGIDEHKMLADQFVKDANRGLNRNRSPRRRRSRSPQGRFGRSSPRRQRRSRNRSSPRRQQRRSVSRSPPRRSSQRSDNNNWEMYKRHFSDAYADLKEDFMNYKKNPESHPDYSREWQKFWMRRCDELSAAGQNPDRYDFQPEWITFWTHRMEELFEDDVNEVRKKIRVRSGLPPYGTAEENRAMEERQQNTSPLSDISQEKNDFRESDTRMNTESLVTIPGKIPSLLDIGNPMKPRNSSMMYSDNERSITSSFRNLPGSLQDLNIDKARNQPVSATVPKRHLDDSPNIPSKRSHRTDENDDNNDELDTGPLNVVSVLRLLTALEEHLGSLGPKVIDLLAKALTLEKVKPNAAEEALLTVENCTFLETVREKLKSQLIAGLLEGSRIKAVKQAIKNVGKLLNQANDQNLNEAKQSGNFAQQKQPMVHQKRPQPVMDQQQQPQLVVTRQQQTPKPPTMERQSTSNNSTTTQGAIASIGTGIIENLDKHELAAKLATALAAQGKTDFTAAQLEQLVAVYILIEKKQRENNSANTGQKLKTLSETLIDYLEPGKNTSGNNQSNIDGNREGSRNESTIRQDNTRGNELQMRRDEPMTMRSGTSTQSYGGYESMNQKSMPSLMDVGNYNSSNWQRYNQNQMQRNTNTSSIGGNQSQQKTKLSLPQYNFGQLSTFDTSLKLSSTPTFSTNSYSIRGSNSYSQYGQNSGTSNSRTTINANLAGISSLLSDLRQKANNNLNTSSSASYNMNNNQSCTNPSDNSGMITYPQRDGGSGNSNNGNQQFQAPNLIGWQQQNQQYSQNQNFRRNR